MRALSGILNVAAAVVTLLLGAKETWKIIRPYLHF
jgi:hypothetical protein